MTSTPEPATRLRRLLVPRSTAREFMDERLLCRIFGENPALNRLRLLVPPRRRAGLWRLQQRARIRDERRNRDASRCATCGMDATSPWSAAFYREHIDYTSGAGHEFVPAGVSEEAAK